MVKLRLEGDGRGSMKALTDLKKALKEAEDQAGKTEQRLTKMEKAARRIEEANDPAKRYNRQLRETAQLVVNNKLSLEQAEKAAARYGRNLERAGQFGRSAMASIGSTLAGQVAQFASVSSLIASMIQGFRTVRADIEAAQQASRGAVGGIGELAQLAATTSDPQGEYKRLLAEARGARASGAFDSENEAAGALFSLVSAGLSKQDRDFAFSLKRSGALQNIGGAATAFSAITTALGAGEVGSFEDFISKSLRASSVAPALANEIPQAAARSAGSAKALGISDEFLYGATAILAKTTGSAPEGGTQLAAFLKQSEKSGKFQGLSGLELVEAIGALPESQQGFGGVLGDRAEAIAGFRTLRDNLDLLRSLTGEIDASQRQGLGRAAAELPFTDLRQTIAVQDKAAEGRLEQTLAEQNQLDALLDAAFKERKRVAALRGGGALSTLNIGAEAAQIGVSRFLGSGDEFAAGVLQEFVSEGLIEDKALLKAIKVAIERQTGVIQQNQQRKPVTGRAE